MNPGFTSPSEADGAGVESLSDVDDEELECYLLDAEDGLLDGSWLQNVLLKAGEAAQVRHLA